VVQGNTEAHWRVASVNAYYALFLDCREALTRWAISLPPHSNVHASVRLRFTYASSAELKSLGDDLEQLGWLRNKASYDLSFLAAQKSFSSAAKAADAIQRAADALALLDAIEADPARRAAAVASFPP
jgi:hypothetical protein